MRNPSLALLATLLAACARTPVEVAAPDIATVAVAPTRATDQALQVAAAAAGTGYRVAVTVDAKVARTHVGRLHAGDRLRVSVLETRWNHDPGAPLYDASGAGIPCTGGGAHECIGGEGTAPMMGLILLLASTEPPPPERRCDPNHRLFIPRGVEFAAPEDTELALGPNDWENGTYNNSGSIRVSVEIAPGPRARPTSRRTLEVDARQPRTPIGHLRAGEYVRVSVLGGSWTHDPGAPLVDAAGNAGNCTGGSAHPCVGGEGTAPLMGLILLMGSCSAPAGPPPRPRVERRFVPRGVDMVLDHDSDVFLAPNDWEDGLYNNTGSARVEVEVRPR
jgi:hypothetical protein